VRSWLFRLLGWDPSSDLPRPSDPDAPRRKARELRERTIRLERMAVEADVIQRSDTSEGSYR
jgi:hypothetical protein